MYRAFKFRLYPNHTQAQLIEQTFGNCRFVYNYYLDKRITLYKESKQSFNYNACSNDLTQLKKTEGKEWLQTTDAFAYQAALENLEAAYQNFFAKHSGFPKFKSKKQSRKSYTTKNNHVSQGRPTICILDKNHIKLPKLKSVKCSISREVVGKILRATISKDPSGKYFVAITCDVGDITPLPKTGQNIGVDLGLKEFATTSNGDKYANPRYLAKSEKKLVKLQRQLSRKTIDGRNREKARIKVARMHARIANQRKDFLHKLSTKLINENDVICLETLRVQNMMHNHSLAKSISDVGWYTFTEMLSYKAEYYGKTIKKIDTYFPSSKTCSNCGLKYNGLTLDIRNWTCPECGINHDRDINAAKNILNEGLRI